MEEMDLILSVDGGGSSSKAVVYEKSGIAIKGLRFGPLSCKSSGSDIVSMSLRSLLDFMGEYVSNIRSCVLALSGLDSEADIENMVKLLREIGFASDSSIAVKESFATSVESKWGFPLILCSDALLPLFSNYFDAGSVVISGTGSVAVSISREGAVTRYGGWGYTVSDEGSGTWIGMRFVRNALAACDTAISMINGGEDVPSSISSMIATSAYVMFEDRIHLEDNEILIEQIERIRQWSIDSSDPKAYASFAKEIIELAYAKSNMMCKKIAERASDKLAHLAYLSFNESAPYIVLSGGVFSNDKFACDVKDKVFKLTKGKAITIVNTKPQTLGAMGIVSYLNSKEM